MKFLIIIFTFFPLVGISQKFGEKHVKKFEIVQELINQNTVDSTIMEGFIENACNGSELKIIYKEKKGNFILTSSICNSIGCETYIYYFSKNQMVFVEEFFDQYPYDEEKGGTDLSRVERNFHGQYLFESEKLIDYQTLGHNRFENDSLDIEETILEEMKERLELITINR